jgi:hypothetical protein
MQKVNCTRGWMRWPRKFSQCHAGVVTAPNDQQRVPTRLRPLLLPNPPTSAMLCVHAHHTYFAAMPITPSQLETLIEEVELEDPIDFADLPFDESALRALVAERLCNMTAGMTDFSDEEKILSLMAVAAKLLLENLVLNVQLLRRDGHSQDDGAALLQRLRDGK